MSGFWTTARPRRLSSIAFRPASLPPSPAQQLIHAAPKVLVAKVDAQQLVFQAVVAELGDDCSEFGVKDAAPGPSHILADGRPDWEQVPLLVPYKLPVLINDAGSGRRENMHK